MNLFPHQREFLNRFSNERYIINAGQPGVGKSLSALALINMQRMPAIIVCPAFLVKNWEAEIIKFFPNLHKETILVDAKYKCTSKLITIVSYNRLKQVEEVFKKARIVIADEASILSSPTNITTKLFCSYIAVNTPQYLTVMTGTPIRNCVGDYYILLALMARCKRDSSFFRKFSSRFSFESYFSNAKKLTVNGRSFTKFSGVRNIDELKILVRNNVWRCKLDDVIKLPELQKQYVIVEGTAIVNDSELEDAYKKKNHISTAKLENELAKVHSTVELLSLEVKKPIVLFGDHIDPVKEVGNQLQQKGWRVGIIVGEVKASDRQEIVNKFQAGELDIVCCTIPAAGLGLTLTKASTCYFIGLSWSNANNSQAAARIRRIGQTEICRYVYVVRKGIDDMITRTLSAKEEVICKVEGE